MSDGEKTRKTLYLDGNAAAVLAEMQNASEYISGLAMRHEREWSGAWGDLRRTGWGRSEVEVAVKLLFDHSMVNDMRGWRFHEHVAEVLGHGQGPAAAAGISPERWSALVAATESDEVANDLLVLSRELALGNDRAKTRMTETARFAWANRAVGEVVMVTLDQDEPAIRTAKVRLDSLGDRAPVFVEHGPYLLDNGSLQVALGLKAPCDSVAKVKMLVMETLGLSSAGWHQ